MLDARIEETSSFGNINIVFPCHLKDLFASADVVV